MKGLVGKRAVVTGGSSGIGQAIAVRLGEEGVDVAINYVSTASAPAPPSPRSTGPGSTTRSSGPRWRSTSRCAGPARPRK